MPLIDLLLFNPCLLKKKKEETSNTTSYNLMSVEKGGKNSLLSLFWTDFHLKYFFFVLFIDFFSLNFLVYKKKLK